MNTEQMYDYSMNAVEYIQFGKVVRFPDRIYGNEPDEEYIERLDKERQLKFFCTYTRHNNGYIREKYLRKLLERDFENWCIPYIVKLCDEYVIQILEVIYQFLKDRNNEDIKTFCKENKTAMEKSCSRMVSYWNEYYRKENPELNRYVGTKLFKECFGITIG